MILTCLGIYLLTCLAFFWLVVNGERHSRKTLLKLFLVSLVWWIALIFYFFDNKEVAE